MRSPISRLKQFVAAIVNRNIENPERATSSENDADITLPTANNAFTSEALSFSQTGLVLKGECNVPFEVRCILVASINEQILGMVTLPKLSSKTSDSLHSPLHFTMPLSPSVLSDNVAKNVIFTLYSNRVDVIATLPCADFLLCAIYQPFAIEKLAPSYGFFGGGKQEPLHITADIKVSAIRFSIPQLNSILNLREISLFDDQDKPINIDQNIEVSCSSNKVTENPAKHILMGEGFHSNMEDSPWLEIHFKQPTKIGRIELTNRTDFWGCRSQKLQVTAKDDAQRTHVLHAPFTEQALAQFYAEALTYVGADCLTMEDECKRRSLALEKTLEYLNQDKNELNSHVFQFVLQLLSTWENKPPSNTVLELELKILAIYVVYSTKKDFKFSFLPYSTLLSRQSDWEYLEKEINVQRLKQGLGTVVLNKNGLSAQHRTAKA